MTTSELIAKYESDLRGLQRIPHRSRDAELANEREEICLNLLRELNGSAAQESSGAPVDLLALLRGASGE